jgi:predicted PurR-regulated permease PerM
MRRVEHAQHATVLSIVLYVALAIAALWHASTVLLVFLAAITLTTSAVSLRAIFQARRKQPSEPRTAPTMRIATPAHHEKDRNPQ